MNFASSKLPLASAAVGGLLIVLSFAWGVIVPKPNIDYDQIKKRFFSQERGHAATTPTLTDPAENDPANDEGPAGEAAETDPGQSAVNDNEDPEEADLQAQQQAEAILKRALFWRETAPMLVRYVGVALAAIGSILYPIQLLIRQEAEEQEEEDSSTVVD